MRSRLSLSALVAMLVSAGVANLGPTAASAVTSPTPRWQNVAPQAWFKWGSPVIGTACCAWAHTATTTLSAQMRAGFMERR